MCVVPNAFVISLAPNVADPSEQTLQQSERTSEVCVASSDLARPWSINVSKKHRPYEYRSPNFVYAPLPPVLLALLMDPTHVYAIATSGTALFVFLKNLLPYLGRLKVYLEYLGTIYLKYPYLLNRHALVGPWTVRNALLLGCYLMINIFCVVFRADLVESGHRAGRLALINLGPLYSGFHLAFLADIFGLTLKACKAVHKTAGLIAFLLAAAHVLIEAATATFAFRKDLLHPWVIIVRNLALEELVHRLTSI